MTDLSRLSATELSSGYASGETSPVAATQAALDAIESHNDRVNAFLLVDSEGALASAAESEKRWRAGETLGPADGIPTSIKDIMLTAGWPTLRGTALIDPAGPWPEDAPAVARLRESGAVIIGKTTTPEFAWKGVTDSPRFGATGNPWGAQLTSGGSSGGSATAVGLGMGTWSVGTDGGGSVRIPAAFTGTVALKPTYGLIPLYPASPFGTLSHAGPMTRSVADAARLLDVITGFDARDWSAMPTPDRSFTDGLASPSTGSGNGVRGLKIGFSANFGYVTNDPEVEAAVRAAVQVLAELGAEIEEIDPGFEDPIQAFTALWFSSVAKVLEPFDDDALQKIDPALLRGAIQGREFTASDYLDATAVRMDLGVRMGRFHEKYDLLVTPTMPIPAFEIGQNAPTGWPSQDWTSWTPYTYPFNLTQQPALSVPCGFTADRRPVGLQFVGPRHSDALVLRAGHAYEMQTSWGRELPTELSN